MPNDIPDAEQAIVDERDRGQCVRCGGMGGARHHRRRRREHDAHTHEPCNVITLCTVCHAWVHANSRVSLDGGWRLKPWVTDPHRQPIKHHQYGWVRLQCDGTFVLLGECESCGQVALLEEGHCMDCLTDQGATVALGRLIERERELA